MESEIFKTVEDYLRQGESLPGLALILAGSLLEYVFPPFPGDTVVLLGAFLAAWASLFSASATCRPSKFGV